MRNKDISRTIESFFVKNRERFIYIHMFMLIVFLVLIFIPAFLPFPSEDAAIFNNFTLAARFILWGLWFPLVLLSVVFFGRLWCGLLCPQGALSEYAGRRGFNKPIPRWERWEEAPDTFRTPRAEIGPWVGRRDYPLAAF